jgi:hypothetical protein
MAINVIGLTPISTIHAAPQELFWYWIAERHAIHLRRESGQPKPWSNDPIFQQYRFTNPFRENDKGTVWLREHFLVPHEGVIHSKDCSWFTCDPEDEQCDCNAGINDNLELLAFNICWYRAFNWIGTGEALGWQTDWNPVAVKELLWQRLRTGIQVFTGAHMVRSKHGHPKIDCIVDVCSEMWSKRHEMVKVARQYRSLQAMCDYLDGISYIGPFQAFEMTTDMRHTRLLNDAKDIRTWASAGPGGRRGLFRLGLSWETPAKSVLAMQLLLSVAPLNLPEGFPEMEMRDIEHSLCEFDKYCRVKFGEGRPRSSFPGV